MTTTISESVTINLAEHRTIQLVGFSLIYSSNIFSIYCISIATDVKALANIEAVLFVSTDAEKPSQTTLHQYCIEWHFQLVEAVYLFTH